MKKPSFSFQRQSRRVVLPVLALLLVAGISQAQLASVGLRYGHGFGGEDFDQYDLSVSMALPWQRSYDSGWLLHADVEGLIGVLTLDGDTAVKPSIMPSLILTSPGKRIDFLAGLGFGVMLGDTEFSDDHDLGGPFFLQGQVGFRVHLTDKFFTGYRYYHQSNAGIYSSNDSVNLHQVEIGYRF